jgi:hypothetical protein
MTWLNASDHLAIDLTIRDRVAELRSTSAAADRLDGQNRTSASAPRAPIALVLGLIGLAVAASVGCATGPRAAVVEPRASEGVGSASPRAPEPEIPDCRGRGSYNRAANLCVSEGA